MKNDMKAMCERAPKERRVTIRIPLGRNASEVVEAGCNGKMYLIRRGESVEAPVSVAEILERAGII